MNHKKKNPVMMTGLFCLLLTLWATSVHADFDVSLYQQFLQSHVIPRQQIKGFSLNVVDYETIYQSRENDKSLYNRVKQQLNDFQPETLTSRDEQIAFWINAYNFAAIKMIIDHYPVDSIRSRSINFFKNPWKMKILGIGNKMFSLDEIEHEILLGKLQEPRAHFAIVCASLSCPDLSVTAFSAAKLSKQLEEQATLFLQNQHKGIRIDRQKKTVSFSKIFQFDKKTFPKGASDAVGFIAPYIKNERARGFLASGNYKIKYLNYNWELNSLQSVALPEKTGKTD
ncbi:MAG: DUF547 domain-containing protein [Thermodesulfobacteriota bacterium]|nr:DUF547 domain-containing protein [Thermodesulfobacteriota bacterium]